VGIDNNMRRYFFGEEASTRWNQDRLKEELRITFIAMRISAIKKHGKDIFQIRQRHRLGGAHRRATFPRLAAKEPFTDFTVNAHGTLVLLEMTRKYCPKAVFIFTSTNKVYGDLPNQLPLVEMEQRWEVDPSHPYAAHGIDEKMSIDQSKHSLFGASKVAADVLCRNMAGISACARLVFGGMPDGPPTFRRAIARVSFVFDEVRHHGGKYTVFGL